MIADMHVHIVPGVDDGAQHMTQALEMLDMLAAQGVTCVMATPHGNAFNSGMTVWERFEALRREAEIRHPRIRLSLGCEVELIPDFLESTLEKLTKGVLPGLGGSKHILTEFLPREEPAFVLTALERMLALGFTPVVAHAERCSAFWDAGLARRVKAMGVLIQVNAYSLSEEKDENIRAAAQRMARAELADMIGSDAHRPTHRPPRMEAGVRWLMENCSKAYTDGVIGQNAERLFFGPSTPLEDGMLGLAVGDALGVPHEFKKREELALHPATGMDGYGTYFQPEGSWSDDTSMALCTADSLCRGFNPDDIMKKFSAWKSHRQYTATGERFDIGLTCRRAIERYEMGLDPADCGDSSVNGNGNGALMRIFPVALMQCLKADGAQSMEEFLAPVHSTARLTHAHERGLICCGMYTLMLQAWLTRSEGEALVDALSRGYERAKQAYTAMGGTFEQEMNGGEFVPPRELKDYPEARIGSSGYVMDTINAALWCLMNTDSYAACVLRAVNLGHDTDTTAAVAGSLAGVVYGRAGIPVQWLSALKNRKLIEEICGKLSRVWSPEARAQQPIASFTGEHSHMALKAAARLTLDDVTYDNAAAAYLAQGVEEQARIQFACLTAHQARRLARQLPEREGYDAAAKADALYRVCLAKYKQNDALSDKLLATGKREIIYDTTGAHDNDMGRCACAACSGKPAGNLYGRTLMRVREALDEEKGT